LCVDSAEFVTSLKSAAFEHINLTCFHTVLDAYMYHLNTKQTPAFGDDGRCLRKLGYIQQRPPKLRCPTTTQQGGLLFSPP